jgi:predicted dithiol-disulfide oxidoreductase (DUF899 family)
MRKRCSHLMDNVSGALAHLAAGTAFAAVARAAREDRDLPRGWGGPSRLTPLGRNERAPVAWARRRHQYGA